MKIRMYCSRRGERGIQGDGHGLMIVHCLLLLSWCRRRRQWGMGEAEEDQREVRAVDKREKWILVGSSRRGLQYPVS